MGAETNHQIRNLARWARGTCPTGHVSVTRCDGVATHGDITLQKNGGFQGPKNHQSWSPVNSSLEPSGLSKDESENHLSFVYKAEITAIAALSV